MNEHYKGVKRQELFDEMARVVKPGGSLAIIVPTGNKRVRELTGTWPFGPQFDFTPMELRGRLEAADFVEVGC